MKIPPDCAKFLIHLKLDSIEKLYGLLFLGLETD